MTRWIARLLLAAIYISGGYDAMTKPGGRPQQVEKAGLPNPELMVRFNGLAMLLGGIGLAFGIHRKLAAGVLISSMVPTTYVGHPFWSQETPQQRSMQKTQFLKNASMVGGLLYAVSDK